MYIHNMYKWKNRITLKFFTDVKLIGFYRSKTELKKLKILDWLDDF